MALIIQRTLLEQLRQHGEQAYPQEACGILLGVIAEDGIRVQSIMRCDNACSDLKHNRYQIGPADLFRAQREARTQGQDIVGFYHSHPDQPARWSLTDLAEAYWTGYAYVITSVEKGKAAATNAFLLSGEEQDKHFEDESMIVAEDFEDKTAGLGRERC